MNATTIILVVIFAFCGLFLIWAVKNGNNIKIKKKEKKTKGKSPKEEKFKDIVPKEKTEKKNPEKIKQSVKDEKSGKIAPPTNKVMKVTKEDYKSNDMAVPKSLNQENVGNNIQNKENELKGSSSPSEFKLPEFPMDFKIPPLKSSGLDDLNFKDDLWADDDFLGADPDLSNILSGDDEFPSFSDDELMKFDDLPPIDFSSKPDIPEYRPSMKSAEKGKIGNESVDDRFSQVFGETGLESSGAKEVIVGDILSGNRSRNNRELRAKRNKWM